MEDASLLYKFIWIQQPSILTKLKLSVFVCKIHSPQACPIVEPRRIVILRTEKSSIVQPWPHKQVWILLTEFRMMQLEVQRSNLETWNLE